VGESGRSDGRDFVCSYDEEIANFITGSSYTTYLRVENLQSSVCTIDAFTVGFMTIARPNNSVTFPSYLPIAQLHTSAKKNDLVPQFWLHRRNPLITH
jgi:hypothetical protein